LIKLSGAFATKGSIEPFSYLGVWLEGEEKEKEKERSGGEV
jgi:hypothetical protein